MEEFLLSELDAHHLLSFENESPSIYLEWNEIVVVNNSTIYVMDKKIFVENRKQFIEVTISI